MISQNREFKVQSRVSATQAMIIAYRANVNSEGALFLTDSAGINLAIFAAGEWHSVTSTPLN
jgi:hypothetical protein